VDGFNAAHGLQTQETDVAFLQRLADKVDAIFTIKGEKLIFHSVQALEDTQPVWLIKKEDISSYSFTDKIKESNIIYNFFDGDKQTKITTETPKDGESGDSVKLRTPVTSQSQQEALAKATAGRVKSNGLTASLDLEGNINLVAGCNIDLQGFGVFDSVMQITKATHTIDSKGYVTKIDIQVHGTVVAKKK
jgi:phage protein D